MHSYEFQMYRNFDELAIDLEELRDKGYTVDDYDADSFQEAWDNHVKQYNPDEIHVTAVTDGPMAKKLKQFGKKHHLVEHTDVPLFYLSKEEATETLENEPWRMDRFC